MSPLMPTLVVDFDPLAPDAPAFAGDTTPAVYFLSFAYAARYGAQHELTQAAQRLRERHKIDLRPLLTFADRDASAAADQRELERVWQDAAPLAECCRLVVETIDADDALRDLLVDAPGLRDRIDELGRIAAWAAERGSKLRLTYTMA